jgi:hypothetical protein
MVISNKIEITINKGNIKYHKGTKLGDKIYISVSDLTPGSNIEIEAKCQFCGNVKKIKYKLYYQRTQNHEEFACSRKCAAQRNKEVLKDKYGVDNIAKVPEVKEKIKNTNLEKYGTEYYMSSEDSKLKRKKTSIEKYGVDNPMKSKIVQEKVKKTNIERYGVEYILSDPSFRSKIELTNTNKYGVDNPSKSEMIKEKIINTNQERYGYNSPLMNEEVKEKSIKTSMDNYGVDNPMKSKVVQEKVKKTNMDRYGVEYVTKNKDVIKKRKKNNLKKYGVEHSNQGNEHRKNFKICSEENYIKYLSDSTSLFKCDQNYDHTFEIKTDNYFSRKGNGIPLCTICNPITSNESYKEKDLYNFIKSNYNGDIVRNYRDGIEIDIYLPVINLGIEFNGLYWHSEKYKERNYHLDKLNYFKEKGIKIIHIWEDDWDRKRDIIKSQILYLMGKSKKIYARKCEVRTIDKVKEATGFLNINHIQGKDRSQIKLGLYYNDDLVSIMTFNKFEGRDKMHKNEYNLSRFCSELNYTVVGGASKLLNHFIKEYSPLRITSYADYSWSSGNLYEKLGFKKIYTTKPDYKYIVENNRKHKSNYQKSKTGISEKDLKFPKIYDCGKIKYEKYLT